MSELIQPTQNLIKYIFISYLLKLTTNSSKFSLNKYIHTNNNTLNNNTSDNKQILNH